MPSLSWSKLVEEADVSDDKVLDPGDYDLQLKSVKRKTTKNDDPMFACRFQVENGPHKGTAVWDNIIIFGSSDKQKALQIHLRKLYTLGANAQFLQTEPTDEQIIAKIEGAHVIATLEIDEYQGQSKNQVKSMKPNKEAVSAERSEAPAPAPKADPAPAETSSPAEAPAATEAPAETTTKKRGSIPLPPPA